MVMDEQISQLHMRAVRRIWLISDLQQCIPAQAEAHIRTAVQDFLSLEVPVDLIAYLGDATEGDDEDRIRIMARTQRDVIGQMGAPVYYVLGNHDFDFYRNHRAALSGLRLPFREEMEGIWHFPVKTEEIAGFVELDPLMLCFFSDHAARDGAWLTTHGVVHGDASTYPYTQDDYRALSRRIGQCAKPVITLSHYAFPGGNRPSDLLSKMLPLPGNVRLHIYGHAHIGDRQWAGKDAFRKIACVDDQAIVQVDVASLEKGRGNAVRSVLLEYYPDRTIGLFFRNHTLRTWDHMLMLRDESTEETMK